MEIGTDFKVVLISVIAVIIAVLVTSFYFALTTPAGGIDNGKEKLW